MNSRDEFILNSNRLTVVMSRIQYKLIVVASKAVFRLVPQDADTYEQADLCSKIRHASCNRRFTKWYLSS